MKKYWFDPVIVLYQVELALVHFNVVFQVREEPLPVGSEEFQHRASSLRTQDNTQVRHFTS